MSEHQTNEVGRLITERLVEEHKNDIPPFTVTSNNAFGASMEVHGRQLLDSFKKRPTQHRNGMLEQRPDNCGALYDNGLSVHVEGFKFGVVLFLLRAS